jgi:hypothetical protein
VGQSERKNKTPIVTSEASTTKDATSGATAVNMFPPANTRA